MDKKAIIVISLCLVFLVFWFQKFAPQPIEQNRNIPVKTTETTSSTEQKNSTFTNTEITSSKKLSHTIKVKDIEVSNSKINLTINPINGIKWAEIKGFQQNQHNNKNVRLGAEELFSFVANLNKSNGEFKTKKDAQNNIQSISSRYVLDNNYLIEQIWTFSDKEYQFNYKFKVTNISGKSLNISGLAFDVAHISPLADPQEGFIGGNIAGIDQVVSFVSDDSLENYSFYSFYEDLKKQNSQYQTINKSEFPQGFDWLAVSNRYFTAILEPSQKELFSAIDIGYSGKELQKNVTARLKAHDVFLNNQQSKEFNFHCYLGPKKLSILEEIGKNKERLVQLGNIFFTNMAWLDFIASIILKFLIFLESLVIYLPFSETIGTYGLAIILLTVLIKLSFWRLMTKTNESMQKMKEIGPKLKALKAKYKNDPQVYAKKQMEIFRQEKINPLGGCLPILIQAPIFLALFNALRGSIELRHSHFLWANDLTQPDTVGEIFGFPINILAIFWISLMILQQIVMQKNNPSMEPIQKKFMLIMMGMIGIFAYGVPSGLTLYWCFQTGISILQYNMIQKRLNNNKIKK